LTFDDGLREIYDVIAPILLEKGVPATFFISSAFLDNRILCYQHKASLLVENISKGLLANTEKRIKEILVNNGFQYSQICEGILKIDYQRKNILDQIAEIVQINFQEYLNEKQPYLTSLQVKKVVNQGFTIGAHSIDHPYYSDLPLAKQLEQTIGSVRHIRQQFGLDYGAFAFPHNDTGVTHAFFSKIQECGFIDITFGTGGLIESDMKNHLQRISMEKPVMHAKKLIVWQYIRRLYMQLKRKLD
jgi:peptidoglycan/xylan/chitin deacetylase (PgdA/CDA1 family)